MNVQFQPVITVEDGTISHYEALYADHTRPLDTYFKRAEANGSIMQHDLNMLHLVLQTLRSTPDVTIALNVSGRSVQNRPFCDLFLGILSEYEDVLDRLEVEITEQYKITHFIQVRQFIRSLRANRITVSIDDFGSGHAWWIYLIRLPCDRVKIDGSLWQRRWLLVFIIQLLHLLRKEIVVEWVENHWQHRVLELLNVHYGQGFIYGRKSIFFS